jgi:hypothetical protein
MTTCCGGLTSCTVDRQIAPDHRRCRRAVNLRGRLKRVALRELVGALASRQPPQHPQRPAGGRSPPAMVVLSPCLCHRMLVMTRWRRRSKPDGVPERLDGKGEKAAASPLLLAINGVYCHRGIYAYHRLQFLSVILILTEQRRVFLSTSLRHRRSTQKAHRSSQSLLRCNGMAGCAVLCCAVLCCAVLCCAVLCCAVLCCAYNYFASRTHGSALESARTVHSS